MKRSYKLVILNLVFVCGLSVNAEVNSKLIERKMKSCVIPEINITSEMTIVEAIDFFRNYKPIISSVLSDSGKFDFRFKRGTDWKIGSNGVAIAPSAVEYHAKNVTYYYALKKVCLGNGYRFRIENGVVRVVPNTINEVQARSWKSARGSTLYGRWVGLLSTGDGIVIRRESDCELIPAYYKNLSDADRKVVETPGDRDFEPYYYLYGDKKLLKTDNVVCTAEEAQSEQRFIDQAVQLIKGKSYFKDCKYIVFQRLDNGALCRMKRRYKDGSWEDGYQGELFFLPSTNVADDDEYNSSYMLWLGTHTYMTVQNERKTVNGYSSCSIFDAVGIVRSLQGFYLKGDRRFASNEANDNSNETEGPHSGKLKISGSGSGVIVTRTGYVLTNAHVIRGASKLVVFTASGRKDAKVIRVDEDTDLALLKIEGTHTPISFANRRKERLGASVFTLGFPRPGLQGFEPKVTKGVISGMEGFKGDVKSYQIDAAIQPGNSGGVLSDEQGNLVGVVCAALISAGEGETLPQNVNYAIKKSYVLAFVDSVPECSDAISEGVANCSKLEEAVDLVRESCALILVYK